MLFNSLTFLVFFAIVLALHQLPLSWRARKSNLLGASYLFYAAWNPPFVLLLWISTLTDWFVARAMARAASRARRRALLATSLSVQLGLLSFFKYGAFLLENFVWLVRRAGIDFAPATPDIVLPVGSRSTPSRRSPTPSRSTAARTAPAPRSWTTRSS